jgi:hypothetical protein
LNFKDLAYIPFWNILSKKVTCFEPVENLDQWIDEAYTEGIIVDFYERDFTEDSFWPMIFITLSISFLRFSDGFFAPVM